MIRGKKSIADGKKDYISKGNYFVISTFARIEKEASIVRYKVQ